MLEISDLSVERDTRRIFENLAFSVRGHQAVQVSGSNGAGKTTLLRTLCGLIRPAAGKILFEGSPINDELTAFLRHVTYVGHENGLKGEFTPSENLQFEQALKSSRLGATVPAMLEQMGIDRLANVPCRYLSTGQKRRTALARLLATDTRLWLLDEPLTGLDKDARELFAGILAEHLDGGGGAIVTSHQTFEWNGSDVVQVQLDDYRAR